MREKSFGKKLSTLFFRPNHESPSINSHVYTFYMRWIPWYIRDSSVYTHTKKNGPSLFAGIALYYTHRYSIFHWPFIASLYIFYYILLHCIIFSASMRWNGFHGYNWQKKAIGHNISRCDVKCGRELKSTFSCFEVHVSMILIQRMGYPIDFSCQ